MASSSAGQDFHENAGAELHCAEPPPAQLSCVDTNSLAQCFEKDNASKLHRADPNAQRDHVQISKTSFTQCSEKDVASSKLRCAADTKVKILLTPLPQYSKGSGSSQQHYAEQHTLPQRDPAQMSTTGLAQFSDKDAASHVSLEDATVQRDCSQPGTHRQHAQSPDFSRLPDIVWINVFHSLGLRERYKTSLGCGRLSRLLDTPCLWRTVTLAVTTSGRAGSSTRTPGKARLFHHHQVFAQRFGKFLQHLTLYTPDVHLHEDTFTILMNFSSLMELRSLTLRLHSPSFVALCEDDLTQFNLFDVLKSWHFPRMHSLCVEFPNVIFETDDRVRTIYKKMYQMFSDCHAFSHVQRLDFHGTVTEYDIYDFHHRFSETPTATVVSSFPHLRHLYITVINLSDELLIQLSYLCERHANFRTLSIEMCFLPDPSVLPQLSSSAWHQLMAVCLDLEVNCHIVSNFTDHKVESVIKPEVPLCKVSLKGVTHDRTVQRMISICRNHPLTLTSFLCFARPTHKRHVTSMVTMVTVCSYLTEFAYHGYVHIDDLTQLASLDRRWRRFEVREDSIEADHVPPKVTLVTSHEETTAAHSKTGDMTEADRDRKLAEVASLLSKRLGFKWRPCQI